MTEGVWPLTPLGSVWSLICKWFPNYFSWLKPWELFGELFLFQAVSHHLITERLHCFIQWKISNTTALKSKAILWFCVKSLKTFFIYSLIAYKEKEYMHCNQFLVTKLMYSSISLKIVTWFKNERMIHCIISKMFNN